MQRRGLVRLREVQARLAVRGDRRGAGEGHSEGGREGGGRGVGEAVGGRARAGGWRRGVGKEQSSYNKLFNIMIMLLICKKTAHRVKLFFTSRLKAHTY